MKYRCILLFLLVSAKSRSAELQADGAVDTRIGLSRRWDVLVHNRSRVRAKENDWYDVSTIPIFRYQAYPNVQITAGAFLSRFEYKDGRKNVCRPIAAVEPSWHRERLTLAVRSTYERFTIFRGTDYNRYRQRVRLIRNAPWSPYAGAEGFFTNQGWASTRYGTGVKRNFGKRDSLEFGYWYEAKSFRGAGVRHVFVTTFTVNFQGFAPGL